MASNYSANESNLAAKIYLQAVSRFLQGMPGTRTFANYPDRTSLGGTVQENEDIGTHDGKSSSS